MNKATLSNLPEPPADESAWPWAGAETGDAFGAECTSWPRVTIVTPSFNQGRYIEQTIRSVLLQGYPNLEYIVIDGGSTDNSVEIIRKYEKWLAYWVSEKDRGQSHAINKGFERATGEVLGWLNSDDFFLPGALQTLMLLRAVQPEAVAWVGGCRVTDGQDRFLHNLLPRVGSKHYMGDWGWEGHFYQPSCLFDGRVFREVGGLVEDLHYVMDVDLWLRMADRGRFASTNEIVSTARLYPEAKTCRNRLAQECEFIATNVLHGNADVAGRRLLRFADERTCTLPKHEILKAHPIETLLDQMKWRPFARFMTKYCIDRFLLRR